MSMPVPLAVRLVTRRSDVHVTRDLRSLSFRTVVPGGFASCTISLNRPLSIQPDDIQLFGQLYVYDTRNGQTVWEGRLEDPGRGTGGDGQVWDISAVGPSAHAQDQVAAIMYRDQSLERWTQVDMTGSLSPGQISSGSADTTTDVAQQSFLFQWDPADALATSDRLILQYQGLRTTGQFLAQFGATHVEGVTSANIRAELVGRRVIFVGSDAIIEADTFSTTPGAISQTFGSGSEMNSGSKYGACELRIITLAAIAASTNNWGRFSNPIVLGSRYLRDGTEKTSAYNSPNSNLHTHHVVEDLLGRMLPKFDGVNATITDSNSFVIDQLAYPDGVTPERVLADLMLLTPNFYWAAWETNPVTGKWRFEWVQWPTTIRYEADVEDGFTSPGSAAQLYNKVVVRYRDVNGQIRTVTRTSTVQSLTDAGLTRSPDIIDLGDEIASQSAAEQVGDEFLADHRYPPNAGTLTVARPILDITAGRMVRPWEIRPGNLIRVRGVLPRVDPLNASDRDGVTVFKVASVSFDADSASATLELDSYSRTVARALADIQKRPTVRRR